MDTICTPVTDPRVLAAAHAAGAESAMAVGSAELLATPTLGFLCSRKCPGDAILAVYDAMRELRDAGVAVSGGFQSVMEKDALEILLRGTQPVVLCAARCLPLKQMPHKNCRKAIQQGRMLLLSPFGRSERRASSQLSYRRNVFVAHLCHTLLAAHASPGGQIEALCRELLPTGKRILTFDIASNANLLAAGAEPYMLQYVQ